MKQFIKSILDNTYEGLSGDVEGGMATIVQWGAVILLIAIIMAVAGV